MKQLTHLQIEKIINTLEFYANGENHDEKYRSVFNSEYYQSEVMLDSGELARDMLRILKSEGESDDK